MSKFRAGRGHFRNLGVKGLIKLQSFFISDGETFGGCGDNISCRKAGIKCDQQDISYKHDKTGLLGTCVFNAGDFSTRGFGVGKCRTSIFFFIFRPRHAKICLWAYADREGPELTSFHSMLFGELHKIVPELSSNIPP